MAITTQMKPAYMLFYFEGLDDALDQDDLDVDKLAEQAMAGPDDVHTVVLRAVSAVAAPLEHDREKRKWVADYQEWITEAGGDADEAYRHFVKGQVDATVTDVTEEVLEVMDPRADDEDDDDCEDEEGDEESDDEDDD